MSAIVAKVMNSTVGEGEIVGFDVLIKNAMMDTLRADIADRNQHRGLVACVDQTGGATYRNSDHQYYYIGKNVGTSQSFTMKCRGSLAVASDHRSSGQTFTVKKNGTVVHQASGICVVSFVPNDTIYVELGANTTGGGNDHYIYAKEVDLRALF